jgi:hypothetical protein
MRGGGSDQAWWSSRGWGWRGEAVTDRQRLVGDKDNDVPNENGQRDTQSDGFIQPKAKRSEAARLRIVMTACRNFFVNFAVMVDPRCRYTHAGAHRNADHAVGTRRRHPAGGDQHAQHENASDER